MARIPYTGIPDQSPELQAPEDIQHVEASPSAFGAQAAEGAQAAGAGGLKLSDFYGQVAADNATNNFLQQRTSLLYGDPSKTVMGPDGKPQADTGFFGLRGADALKARPEVTQQLDEQIAEQRETLQTPLARQQFDVDTRRYRAQTLADMGQHADQQYKVWATDTNNTASTIALNQVSRVAGDDAASSSAGNAAINAYVKNAQLAGEDVDGAKLKAQQDIAQTRIRALVVSDPSRAKQVLDASAGILGSLPNYDTLTRTVNDAYTQSQLNPALDTFTQTTLTAAQQQAAGANLGTTAHPSPSGTMKPGVPMGTTLKGPVYDQIAQAATQHGANANEQYVLNREAHLESGGNPSARNGVSTGLFQFHPDTFARLGGTDINDVGQQTAAALQLMRQNAHQLTAAGVQPIGANLYLMHQQGPAGGLALLTAPPEVSAVAALAPAYHGNAAIAERAIVGNGGTANMTAGQFVDMWQKRWEGAGGSGGVGTAAGVPSNPGQYPSTADALRANMATNTESARTYAEKMWPTNPNDIQDRFIEGYTRRANETISQQEQQYTVDTHTIQAAIATGRIKSEADIESDPTLSRAWESVQVNNPFAGMALQRRLDADSHGPDPTLGANFKDYFDRATAPAGSPDRITNSMSLNTFVGSGKDALLTNTGVDQLSGVLDARGTPQGEAFASQARTFVDQMYGELTFANAGAGQFDPKGEARFNAFMATALPVMMNAYKAGSAAKVLDPNSPDYLGKTAQTFMRSPAEIMRDRLADHEFSDVQAFSAKSVLDTGDSNQEGLFLLKDAVTRGRLTAQQAVMIGNALGYSSTRAPPPAGTAPGAAAGERVGAEIGAQGGPPAPNQLNIPEPP